MQIKRGWLATVLAGALAMALLTGCGEGPGSRGGVFVMVNLDASIASINVTELDLPSNPSALTPYQAATHRRRVTWTAIAGPTNYAAYVDFRAHPGEEEGEECILIFCTTAQGDDGKDRTFLLEFANSNLTVSEVQSIAFGTVY